MVSGGIFIVEDDPVVAELIRWRIRELGYPVCKTVQTGEEAIEYCRSSRPDAVLMDIGLKGKIDGIEAAMMIRQQKKIPLIFITAHTEEKYLDRAKRAMPEGFIKKPFEDDDIRIALKFLL